MSEFYTQVESWVVPKLAWRLAFDEMAHDGHSGNEGTCLWVGKREGTSAAISDIVILRGDGIRKCPDLITISDDLIHELAHRLAGSRRYILGQIHSHGIEYSTDLSLTDHRYTLRVPGFLSIVAPDYAQQHVEPDSCGVHIFESGLGFRRMEPSEVRHRITLDDQRDCGVICVGGS